MNFDPGYVESQRKHNMVHNDFTPISEAEAGLVAMKTFLTMLSQFDENVGSILDIGCRYGYSLNAARAIYPEARLVGVDIVPEFVEEAKDLGLEAYEADQIKLPFEDREFEWVFSSHSLEHASDTKAAAMEITRVAKNGLFLVVPLEREEWERNLEVHKVFYPNPMQWLELISYVRPDFSLISARTASPLQPHSSLTAMFVQNDYRPS